MKYTKEERLEIGRRIYTGEMNRYEASEKYNISADTARDYMRLYRDVNELPPRQGAYISCEKVLHPEPVTTLNDYASMTKEQLIHELLMTKISEARLKKGYMVKGDGPEREYILLDIKNTK